MLATLAISRYQQVANLPYFMISMETEGIHVTPHAAPEKSWLLRNDTKFHSQILQANGAYVKIVDENSAT